MTKAFEAPVRPPKGLLQHMKTDSLKGALVEIFVELTVSYFHL
jgi:hypothetical protein